MAISVTSPQKEVQSQGHDADVGTARRSPIRTTTVKCRVLGGWRRAEIVYHSSGSWARLKAPRQCLVRTVFWFISDVCYLYSHVTERSVNLSGPPLSSFLSLFLSWDIFLLCRLGLLWTHDSPASPPEFWNKSPCYCTCLVLVYKGHSTVHSNGPNTIHKNCTNASHKNGAFMLITAELTLVIRFQNRYWRHFPPVRFHSALWLSNLSASRLEVWCPRTCPGPPVSQTSLSSICSSSSNHTALFLAAQLSPALGDPCTLCSAH